MNIDELTLGQIKEIQGMCGSKASKSHPYTIGKNYFIRTVTHYYTGRLAWVGDQELVLEEAAWIADTGRFNEALKNCELSEVEPYPGNAIIGRGAICDASLWEGPLPRGVK